MNGKMKGLPGRSRHALALGAGFFPLTVWIAASATPKAFAVLPLFALLYALFAAICILIPGKWRIFAAFAGGALLFGLAMFALPVREAKSLLLIPLLYTALLLVSLPACGWAQGTELSPMWYVAGLVCHILLQILQDDAARRGLCLYKPAAAMLLMAFLVFAALGMLTLNRGSLESAAQSRVKVPLQMRRQNALLTMGLLLLALLLAALPAIGAFLRRVWQWLLGGVAAAAGFFVSLLSGGGEVAGGDGEMPRLEELGTAETVQPGAFEAVLEKILAVFGLIITAFLIIWLLRKAAGALRRLLQWVWQSMSRFGNAAVKDYEDEITDTRDDGEYRQTGALRRLRVRLSRPDESKMTPAQRVRYRYRRMRMKHTDWRAATTARETLPDTAAQLYERVRYGGELLTEEEAESFRRETRHL